ncbi:MAG: hypothetical protein ACI8QZ_000698, partial [Chlamydiales bacterium]
MEISAVRTLFTALPSILTSSLLAAPGVASFAQYADSRAPFAVTLESELVEVDMDHTSGHVLVDVWVHAEGPFRFVLDTCAGGYGYIDASLVEELGLTQTGTVVAGDGTGKNAASTGIVSVEFLELKGAAFEGMTMIITPAAVGGRSSLGRGILGIGLFKELLLTLDYGGSKVRVTRASLDPEGPHVAPLYQGYGLPEVDIQIGSSTMRAHIDSGNMGKLLLPGSLKDSFELEGELQDAGRGQTVANNFQMWAAPLAEPLRFAG